MRVIAFILVILLISTISLCWAQEASLEKAYSLYYKGEKESAIRMMEEYVSENPEPAAFYFLGYAYYEMKKMDIAAKYFNEAFVRSPFYSPLSKEKN